MKCAECQFENPEGVKFCGHCGNKLEKTCPECGFSNPPQFKFCGQCGGSLVVSTPTNELISENGGERKYVTALFSDLSGYTAMTERLDPEEVKKITSRIFGEIGKIIDRYEGFIENYSGDGVMMLFGVPNVHEDDPLRAIRAAKEIHKIVETLSPDFEAIIGKPVSMHTGISTGLVVTGKANFENGIHGVAGDALNVASRLSDVAEAGEILVGQAVYRQTLSHFNFQVKGPIKVKGKAESLPVYRVISPKEGPTYFHGLSVLRANLIGRNPDDFGLKICLFD
ncbi:MAG: adenylate/guanylate cyclase domain-containing protein [Deltaproteobacteria bacterium]|nr:adenylate/guanylate cyclase domain-containing protein [Deltaproteobacteria bacterium]